MTGARQYSYCANYSCGRTNFLRMAMSGGWGIENHAFTACAANRGLQPLKDTFPRKGNVGGGGIEKPRIHCMRSKSQAKVVEGQIPS